MGVCAHYGVRECGFLSVHRSGGDDAGQVFQVDLVNYAGAGGHYAGVPEGLLGPPQQGVSFMVPFILPLHVAFEGVRAAEEVDLYRVVYDQVHGHYWVDAAGVAAHAVHCGAHARQVHDGRNAGEVLKEHAGGIERYLPVG